MDAATITTVRSNGATILEQTLTRPFIDLEPLGERALEAVQQARARIDDTCDRAASDFLRLRDSITSQIQQTPPHKEPVQAEAVLANVKAIAAFVVSGIVGCCALGMLANRNDRDSTMPVWLAVALTIGAVIVGFAFRADRRSTLENHRAEIQPAIEQWMQWRKSSLSQVQAFEARMADMVAKFEKILIVSRSPRVETSLGMVRAISAPVVPNSPPWTAQ